MSGDPYNFPHGYRYEERQHDGLSPLEDQIYATLEAQLSPYSSGHYAAYQNHAWSVADEYDIQIDTSAVGPYSGILNADVTPAQSSYTPSQQQQWPHTTRRPSGNTADGFSGSDYLHHPGFGFDDLYSSGQRGQPMIPHHFSEFSNASPPIPTESLLSANGYGSSQMSPHSTPPLLYQQSPPTSPSGSQTFSHAGSSSPSPSEQYQGEGPLYTHKDQLRFFKEALSLPAHGVTGPFVPQLMYKPHTNSDRRRYVEEIGMEAPIHFWVDNPSECGIPLIDALHSRVRRMRQRDDTVFEGRGPSVSIRLEWPGYRQWSRQIPTKDFRSPPGPITRAKLAKNVAKCVQRFIQERQTQPLEDDADPRWRVGTGHSQIKLEDLILVSIHHVSMGSWQPHLRLMRPL